MTRLLLFWNWKRGNYHVIAHLSSIQHLNLTPCRFVTVLCQMTWTRLIWGLKTTSSVNLTRYSNFQIAYYIKAFMLGEWEVGSCAIILSLSLELGMFSFAYSLEMHLLVKPNTLCKLHNKFIQLVHNTTQLLGCVMWDKVLNKHNYPLILGCPVYEEHSRLCTRIEAPITVQLRDSAPNLEKYKAVKKFPM